jgi:transcriptional regulator with XRE-family HTH domain
MNPFDLKALRKARDLNQSQLATLIGTEQARVSKIENDTDSISVGQYRRILEVLGVSVSGELLDG